MGSVSNGRTRRLAIVAVAVGAAICLAACSSSSGSSTRTTAAKNSGAAGGSNSGGTSSSGSSSVSRLASVTSKLSHAQGAPFEATYSADYNGSNQTMTIAQDPPKSYFAVANSVIIDTGSSTYYCPTTPNPTCVNSSSGNPASALVDAFSPKAALSQLQAAQTAVASRVADYDISFSSQSFAGQPSQCVSTKAPSGAWKYCVTDAGQLAYASSSPQQVFQMTSFSSSPNPSYFALPTGATVESIPSS
jgi:hypothetical protein